ncbi:PhnD/SsuA/transferrin family substrate-binding protein [Balamuthia mandrillaris]
MGYARNGHRFALSLCLTLCTVVVVLALAEERVRPDDEPGMALLPMYEVNEEMRKANDVLWKHLSAALRQQAQEQHRQDLLPQIPERLFRLAKEDSRTLLDLWQSPDLLMGQTCGYPFVRQLKPSANVQLVLTPSYGHFESHNNDSDSSSVKEGYYRSLIVVRKGGDIREERDLLGKQDTLRAVINDHFSNSGMNLFRDYMLNLMTTMGEGEETNAQQRRCFAEVKVSGGHRRSIEMVARGEADVASVDCFTFAFLKEQMPEVVADVMVVGRTRHSPGLPIIAAEGVSKDFIEMLRSSWTGVLKEKEVKEELRWAFDVLHITGFRQFKEEDYAVILEMEKRAIAAGYPILA